MVQKSGKDAIIVPTEIYARTNTRFRVETYFGKVKKHMQRI
jgi:hypothetical protein